MLKGLIIKTIKKTNGQTVVVLALSIVVLLSIVGLAIDSGIGYGVKAKLSSAVDAAALAAGNAPYVTGNYSAINAATRYFNANYPKGYLRSTITGPTTTVTTNTTTGQTLIEVTATASVPTYFMRIVGLNSLTPSVTADATRNPLDLMLVMDNTGSLSGVGSTVKSAAISFINKFYPNADRIGLIKFDYGAQVTDAIKTSGRGFNAQNIVNDINAMTFNGDTNFSEPFWDARAQLDGITSRSASRVIVFFSDGSGNSFSSTFNGNPGVILSGDSLGPSPTPSGLAKIGVVSNSMWYTPCNPPYSVSTATIFPQYATWPSVTFVTHGVNTTIPGPPATLYQVAPPLASACRNRPVPSGNLTLDQNGFIYVNDAARNLAEEMASDARSTGIYVYTLGEGPELTTAKNWGNDETGDAVLMDMANDPRAITYNPQQPVGMYAYAPDETHLQQAFTQIANQILRLSR